VVSRAQCLRAGLTAEGIRWRLGAGRLFAIHRGVYAVGHPGLLFEGRCVAAVLATGGWAGHGAAAVLWGLRRPHRGVIDVVTATRRRAQAGIRVHRTRSLTDNDVTYRHRVPVTNLRRTLIDLADTATPTAFEEALRAAERIHRFDRDTLTAINGRHGTKTLTAARPLVRGHLEPRFLRIIRHAGLPAPETNVPFERFVLDAVWWHARVAVEVDDWQTHQTRHAFRNDRAKGNLLATAGLTLLRFTNEHLEDEGYVVATLRDAGVRPG
jgi:hypothetical protein